MPEKQNHNCMVAFVFDSGKFNLPFYGTAAIEAILRGGELQKNKSMIVVSAGDIVCNKMYIDLFPYAIFDDLCTIQRETIADTDTPEKEEKRKNHEDIKDLPYAIVMEDIEIEIAKKIDLRLSKECKAYLGMTRINPDSSDKRKQFWKETIRLFSLSNKTCVVFDEEENGFVYEEEIRKAGYEMQFAGSLIHAGNENYKVLPPAFQSSFIKTGEQLEWIDGHDDSARNILNMNFSLVKEVEIAGIDIWKAIEDINRVELKKACSDIPIAYVFTSFYQAAQGIERLLKILVELVVYIDKNRENEKTEELLYSHNHIALVDYLERKGKLKLDTISRKLLQILSAFYNNARYSRYVDDIDNKKELNLLNEFGSTINSEGYDEEFKKLYGKTLGKISRAIYRAIEALSHNLNIYVYELDTFSTANIVFSDYYQENLYKSLREIEQAKKEILWYLISKGDRILNEYIQEDIPPISFKSSGINGYISAMIKGNLCESDVLSFIKEEYKILCCKDKEKLKKRYAFLDYLFSNDGLSDHFLPDDSEE